MSPAEVKDMLAAASKPIKTNAHVPLRSVRNSGQHYIPAIQAPGEK